MQIKIGILTKPLEKLEDWELKIFDQIIQEPELDIVCLFTDGRQFEEAPKKGLLSYLKPFNFLYKWQIHLEERFFKAHKFSNTERVLSYLKTLPLIPLNPTKKNFVDYFDHSECEKISPYGLDLLLRHEFGIIKGEIFKVAKYGIWSFHHADNDVNRGGPAGFWEARLKQDVMGITLQQLNSELDGGKIIDKAFFNNQFSMIKNRRRAQMYSSVLLLKYLRLLKNDRFETKESQTYHYPLYRRPGLKDTLAYLWVFYNYLVKKKKAEFVSKNFNAKLHTWTLAVGKGHFLQSPLFRTKELNVPQNAFWADPHLFEFESRNYIFFENFSYDSGQASISCGELIGNKLENITEVINQEKHYSYPQIIEEDGNIYMIPESALTNRLEVYKCLEFPHRWELYKTCFEGESIADVNYLEDQNGDRWLFLSKSQEEEFDHCTELHIYKIDSLELNQVEEHRQNPVILDSRKARNGGPFFTYNGELYRPSQQNVRGIYGYGLKINKVKELNLEHYVEEDVIEVLPHFKKGLSGIHHLHQGKNIFIIDYAYSKK
ncbi:glucosamine inositolphosphorylceramide transferase family protein [Mongoliibacter ruber]|uniref:Glucosamine inositolphosphorylceramide transferase 1 N-terminal domain-containing protein n=1 Tax=Mongoliibacter ruber TaxID=1750599 RepID=A0A2T0WNT7_9BACT|nr:hypothetical protein [Mongoliibacter ruber]PRY88352.1 hypothetical protein CLW00_1043 [Mongoliibacter ruber]